MKWKTIIASIALAACSLCVPLKTTAQAGYCYNSNYSSYTNASVDSSQNIIQTVQVSGYITLNNPAVWGGPTQAGYTLAPHRTVRCRVLHILSILRTSLVRLAVITVRDRLRRLTTTLTR